MASLELVESPQTATAKATRNDIDNERVQMENKMEMVEGGSTSRSSSTISSGNHVTKCIVKI